MIRCIAVTAVVILVLIAGGALAFLHSGMYDIAASSPHLGVVRWSLTTLQKHSVRDAASDIRAPRLDEADLVGRGFEIYEQRCVVCHGAPGVAPASIGRGMNPKPPRLSEAADQWDDAELYWIVTHGLRMAGMPAFEKALGTRDRWAVVAFLRRQQALELTDYAAMRAAAEGQLDPARVQWVSEEDPGWERMRTAGDASRGWALIRAHGCVTCHAIPGVRGPGGTVGPPLSGWAGRRYIAGALLNRPTNLITWISDPQSVEPGTAMPDLGVSEADALHMAAYLYSLE